MEAAAPLERIPLFIRAGSIVPLGPDLQWATEKAADPLELRVYRGADGDFTLYEDENDTYNYEKGQYATIQMHWDEARQTLTIGERTGRFPGMLQERAFHIVMVGLGHGVGIAAEARPDRVLRYNGKAITIAP